MGNLNPLIGFQMRGDEQWSISKTSSETTDLERYKGP